MRRFAFTLFALCGLAGTALGQQIWDLVADWSEGDNPNGPWSYCEALNPLPHVDAWEGQLHWPGIVQPGWADSENGIDRIPFWFQVAEGNDALPEWEPGDVVVHTTDGTNGVGNGHATLVWRSPIEGEVDVRGGMWFVRDISRSVHWTLRLGGLPLAEGNLWSGDPYDRENLQDLRDQELEPGILDALPVQLLDELRLELTTTSPWGDFVGIRLLVQEAGPLAAPTIDSIVADDEQVAIQVSGLAGGATHWMQRAEHPDGPWSETPIPVLEGSSSAVYTEAREDGADLRLYRAVSRRGE